MWGEENTSQLRKRWCSELRLSTRPSGLADTEPKTDRPPSEIPERATGHQRSNAPQGLGVLTVREGRLPPPWGFREPEMRNVARADVILERLRHFHGMLRGLPLKSLSSHEPTS